MTLGMIMLASLWWAIFCTQELRAGEYAPYESDGTVLGIEADQGLILLDHDVIQAPGFFMAPMEMAFSVSNPSLLNGLKAGDHVQFRVSEEKRSRIVALKKLP
jgi:Cu/Ag efflux protein CusF